MILESSSHIHARLAPNPRSSTGIGPISRRDVAFAFQKAIPSQILRIPIIVYNKSDSIAGQIGLEVIEARTTLNAVLEGVYKDPKVGTGLQIGLAEDIELGM